MTYSTTHIGISTLLIYFFAPTRIKEYLKQHPYTFFWISLGSVIPDLDILTRGHRAYGHSIFFPLILILIAPYLGSIIDSDQYLTRKLKLFGVMWITHLLYDTTFGPIALFFPIDNRFYDINMGIIIDNTGFLFFAVFIGGFFISIKPIDQETGTNTFFINWTKEQRIQTFGETINFPISDFVTHATIFFFYTYLVLLPVLKLILSNASKKNAGIDSFRISIINFVKKNQLNSTKLFTPIILFLLTTSLFIAGPMDGRQWIDNNEETSNLWVLTTDLQLVGNLFLSVPENSQMDIIVKPNNISLEMQLFVTPINNNQFNEINDEISRLLNLYNNKSIDYPNLVKSYQNYIQNNSNIPTNSVKSIGDNKTANWTFSSETDLALIIGLSNWNISDSFIISIRSSITWIIDRTASFIIGTIFFIISLVLTVNKTIKMFRKNDN